MLKCFSKYYLREEVYILGKNQHVVPTKNGWGVRGEKNTKITASFNTQAEAIERATSIARNQQSEMFIHGRDVRIRERNSYGNDPFPPKG